MLVGWGWGWMWVVVGGGARYDTRESDLGSTRGGRGFHAPPHEITPPCAVRGTPAKHLLGHQL